jgi:hypothetical protein
VGEVDWRKLKKKAMRPVLDWLFKKYLVGG